MRVDISPSRAKILAEKQVAKQIADAAFQAALDTVLAEYGVCTVTHMDLMGAHPHMILGGDSGSTV